MRSLRRSGVTTAGDTTDGPLLATRDVRGRARRGPEAVDDAGTGGDGDGGRDAAMGGAIAAGAAAAGRCSTLTGAGLTASVARSRLTPQAMPATPHTPATATHAARRGGHSLRRHLKLPPASALASASICSAQVAKRCIGSSAHA